MSYELWRCHHRYHRVFALEDWTNLRTLLKMLKYCLCDVNFSILNGMLFIWSFIECVVHNLEYCRSDDVYLIYALFSVIFFHTSLGPWYVIRFGSVDHEHETKRWPWLHLGLWGLHLRSRVIQNDLIWLLQNKILLFR